MEKLRTGLWCAAILAGGVVALRWVAGPYSVAGVAVNTPLNPEGAFGVLVTALLMMRRGETGGLRPSIWESAVAALVAVAILWPATRVGFLSDDFILVEQAREFTNPAVVLSSPGGDGFFRPLGYVSMDLTGLMSGQDPFAWHLWGILLHAVNAALVALLAIRLGASRFVAGLAGILFALHGTHLEAAVWIAGRFDLLAVLFTLGGLAAFERNTAVALLCTLAALWSKEAAYVLPALVTLLAWHERRSLRTTLPYWALAGVAFVYRWVLLGGIGGYREASGETSFYSLKVATTAKAVFVRLWTSLCFPWNWSSDPSVLVGVAACLYIAALLWLAWRGNPTSVIRVALLGLAISILPPLHLLGGAADLSGGRLLYLPSVWFCLLLAFAANRSTLCTLAIILFHFAALRHDLPFWQRASDQVREICEQATPPAEPPRSIDGVPALANGYAQCIQLAREP